MNLRSLTCVAILFPVMLARAAAAPVWTIDQVSAASNGCATAFLPDGRAAVVCRDAGTDDLIYAVRSGATWDAETVASDALPSSAGSLAIDPQGRPAVAYEDNQTGQLKLARHDGNAWTSEVVDDQMAGPSANALYHARLVFAPGGDPAIAYRYGSGQNGALRYARRGPSGWAIATPDGDGPTGNEPSLAFAPGGEPSISYFSPKDNTLKLARLDGGVWVLEDISPIDIAYTLRIQSHLAFAPGGQPVVAFTDGDDLQLRLAEFNGLDWDIVTVLTTEDTCFADGFAYDAHGKPIIAYHHFREAPALPFLGIARYDGLQWNVHEPDASAWPFGSVSFARGPSGHLGIAFNHRTPASVDADHTLRFAGAFAGIEVFEGFGTGGEKRENGQPPYSFGDVPVNGMATVAFTVRNNGFEPMDFVTQQLSGADAAAFVLPAGVSELAAGASASFPVTFAPESAGPHTATLTVASEGAPGSPLGIALGGTGIAATGGDAFGFGDNDFGALGDGGTGRRLSPVAVSKAGVLAGLSLTDIAAGDGHTLARDTQGKLFAWGYNATGQLGDGSQEDRLVPVAVDMSAPPSGTFARISSGGGSHNLALDREGKIFAWGNNGQGQLGVGDFSPRLVPAKVPDTGALAGVAVVEVVAGHDNSFALTYDGRVFAWGYNLGGNTGAPGKLGDGTATAFRHSPVEVDASGALAGKFIRSLSASSTHTLALSSDGELFAWGENDAGQLGDGTTESRLSPVPVPMAGSLAGKVVASVSAGPGYSLAIASDGSIHAWGDNSFGQFGDGSTGSSAVPVAAGTGGSLSGKTPVLVRTGSTGAHSLASDGTLHGWGQAVLGNGTEDFSLIPVAAGSVGGPVISLARSRPDTLFLAIPAPVPPSVTLAAATDIGVDSAQLSAVADAGGGLPVTSRGFVIAATAQNADPELGGDHVTEIAAGSGTGSFSAMALALVSATSHTFRAYATNSSGATGYSDPVIFTTTTNPLETWRQIHFPGSTATTGPGANQAAPRGDGIPNLIKFALGLSPSQPGVLPVTLGADADEITYTYTPSAEALAAGVVFTVEFSGSLESGSWSGESVTQGSASAPGQPVTASRAKPLDGPAFLRLKAELP